MTEPHEDDLAARDQRRRSPLAAGTPTGQAERHATAETDTLARLSDIVVHALREHRGLRSIETNAGPATSTSAVGQQVPLVRLPRAVAALTGALVVFAGEHRRPAAVLSGLRRRVIP